MAAQMELLLAVPLIFMISQAMGQPVPNIQANTSSLSPICLTSLGNPSLQSICEEDLYSKVRVTVQDYTEKFAQRYSVCVGDP